MRRLSLALAALLTILAVCACGKPAPRRYGGCGPILLAKHRYGCAPTPTVTANYYVAQTAAGTGSGSGSCSNAAAVSTLSTSTEWTAGNVIGLCGTITSTITAQGSGTSGSPITVYWEPGASMTMSASSCSAQCINISGQNYITLNGGTNGTITVPNNGDSGTTNVGVRGISVSNASNITIEYLTLQNLYVATSGTAKSYTGEDPAGVWVINSPNFVLDHDTLSKVGDEGVIFSNTAAVSGTTTVSNDDFTGENWEIASSGSTSAAQGAVYIYGNRFGSVNNWDTSNDAWHHNGIFCYTGGSGYTPHYDGWYIYNNLFNGSAGADFTSWLDLQGCSDDTTEFYVFNDIFATADNDVGNGDDNGNWGIDPLYNSEFIGAPTTGPLLYIRNCGAHDVRNTLFLNGAVGEAGRGGSACAGGGSNPTYSFNNNLYANSLGGATFSFDVPPSNSQYNWNTGWSPWVSGIANYPDTTSPATGADETNSFGAPGSSQTVTNPSLDSNYDPTTGSAALSAGQNLYSLCSGQANPGLGALCDTYAGPTPTGTGAGPNGQWATPSARPSSGAWNIGAY